MCGRTRCTLRPDDVPRASHRDGVPARYLHFDRFRPSYNVAPGSFMPVLRRDNDAVGDGVAVHCMKWGLVPAFTKKTDKPDFFKMFNARSESVAEKASFRRLLPKNRCLVAVDGFYEWMKEGSKKQPYYIHFKDGRPLVFAALYDSWQNSEGEALYTFTILTTSSSSALHWLHDRMPVILGDKPSVDIWLDDPSTSKLKPILVPYEKSDLVWYPVTPAIGKLSFNGPECIQQVPLKASKNNLISNFFSTQPPKIDKEDRETKLTNSNIPVDLKEELTAEGYEAAGISNRTKKNEESDNEKSISNEAPNPSFQKIGKEEPLLEDNSAVASHLEPVKNEAQESEIVEDKSIKTESHNLDLLRNLKEEPEIQVHGFTANEELNQPELAHESVQDKPQHEDQQTTVPYQNTKDDDIEFNKESPGKSATKRDYEAFSGEQKPWKHSEKRRDVKSCGKQGKKQGSGKSNVKNSKEKQSTLHFFFDGK